jgi:hypothetical protein
MIEFVALTALLVLAVVVLFRFVGCDVVFGLAKIPATIAVQVDVPTELTFRQVRFQTDRPNGVSTEFTKDNPTGTTTPDGFARFSHDEGQPVVGIWTVRCRVAITDSNGIEAQKQGLGTFMIDDADASRTASFQVSGSPSTNNFDVNFVGLT